MCNREALRTVNAAFASRRPATICCASQAAPLVTRFIDVAREAGLLHVLLEDAAIHMPKVSRRNGALGVARERAAASTFDAGHIAA